MQLRQDGTPVITTPQDASRANRFIEQLVDRFYDRLPRIVKLFISKERLVNLLRDEVQEMANSL